MRWAQLFVSAEGCVQTIEVVDRVRAAVEDAAARDSDSRLLACRIELTGQTEVHDRLLVSTEHLLAEARAGVLARICHQVAMRMIEMILLFGIYAIDTNISRLQTALGAPSLVFSLSARTCSNVVTTTLSVASTR